MFQQVDISNVKYAGGLNLERPISRITASISILGSGVGMFALTWSGISTPPELYAFIGGIVGSAATFLFMDEDYLRGEK